jgi:protein-serine/threonine kinase
MPEQWSKLLTQSATTREDYQRNPQALEFYTDNHKCEMEEMGLSPRTVSTLNTRAPHFSPIPSPVLRPGCSSIWCRYQPCGFWKAPTAC